MAITPKTTKKATKIPAVKPPAARKPTARKKAPAAAAPVVAKSALGAFSKATPERRFRLVQEAAYLLAEKDGFKSDPHTYWVTAEKQFGK